MSHVSLGLVFHQHQPLGNYGFVFEKLYELSYEPLLAALERHPGVKAGLHYSGPLIEWLQAARPEYIARVRALVERGQVEMLGGGYYEPILAAISEADRVGQLTKMRTAVGEIFGKEPTGMWLPERVWEPELPTSIAAAGYDWTLVDDVHFAAAGFPSEELAGWYLTEDDGQRVGVYGSSTAFRYLVPWGTVDACIDYLRHRGDRIPGSVVVMGDDGEKFGGWPTTYAHCWENGWVDAFFGRLEQEAGWLETVHLGDWKREHLPVSLAYLPTTSYMEMGEWSLPPSGQHALDQAKAALRDHGRDDLVALLRGGHWRNFLVRYPEVNLLHKRILRLSAAAHRTGNEAALDHVWRAQCNCPFWHGVFGGVYLEHIRHENYGHLAAADEALYPGPQPAEVGDLDYDGRDEICLRSDRQLVVVAPGTAGEILHWELREVPWHLTHVVARRPEAYHMAMLAAEGREVRNIHDDIRVKDAAVLNTRLVYDRGLRLGAEDTLTAGALTREEYGERRLAPARRTVEQRYDGTQVTLECMAGEIAYSKQILVDDELTVLYALPAGVTLVSEWNLSLPEFADGTAPRITLGEGTVRIETGRFTLVAAHNAADAWQEQVFTASNTEGGIELAQQGWAIAFATAPGDAPAALDIRWRIEP